MIVSIFNWIKAIVMWVFNNQGLSIVYLKKGLDIASFIAELTPTGKDNKGIEYLNKKLKSTIEILPFKDQQNIIKAVDKSKDKRVNELLVGFNSKTKEVNLGIAGVEVGWDTKDGAVKVGYGFKL